MAKLSKQNQKTSGASNNNDGTKVTTNGVTKVKRTRRTVPRDSPPQRSSIYRGVTRHRWTGRYEAHLWDKNCWNESQDKKGRQVYLGAYDEEEAAAHAYDLAALKYWGPDTILNFPLSTYQKELKEMKGQSREEYIGSLRRKSSGFSRGISKYRGVARHHHNGRWEARIGRIFGNKCLYLGTYATQEEAAMAYDMAAIEYRGLNAVTNFNRSRYIKWIKPNQINGSTINTNNNNNNSFELQNNASHVITSNGICSSTNITSYPNQDLGLNFFQPQLQQEHQTYAHQVGSATLAQSRPTHVATTATSALGLLLQSSKFQEMIEMTASSSIPPGNSSQALMNTSPVVKESSSIVLDPSRSNFPDDIRTCFAYQDLMSGSTCEGSSGEQDMFFGDLNSYVPQMFQFDFDS